MSECIIEANARREDFRTLHMETTKRKYIEKHERLAPLHCKFREFTLNKKTASILCDGEFRFANGCHKVNCSKLQKCT